MGDVRRHSNGNSIRHFSLRIGGIGAMTGSIISGFARRYQTHAV